jgi:hypothetical protein
MMKPQRVSDFDLNVYIDFALHAILGRLGEADAIMRFAGDSVRRVADDIAAQNHVDSAVLHRGMLLDPDVPFATDPKLTFMSWSEDHDVAMWFACPRSVVSEPLAKMKPELRGYVATINAPASRVLFHHSWAALGGLACFALIHPLMGEEGRRQIEWSLRTQREVITEPAADLRPERAADLDSATLEALERRLSPPWIVEEEGIRS